jgi:hypothetical protein
MLMVVAKRGMRQIQYGTGYTRIIALSSWYLFTFWAVLSLGTYIHKTYENFGFMFGGM